MTWAERAPFLMFVLGLLMSDQTSPTTTCYYDQPIISPSQAAGNETTVYISTINTLACFLSELSFPWQMVYTAQ